MTDRKSPDAMPLEDWAGEMGARWLANLAGFEGTIAPVGEVLLTRAAFAPGERVLDIGCGGGATTLSIARAVAPGGIVLGVDISQDLVSAATRRAAQAGITNARFLCADAATASIPAAPYDRLCSRFGSMFFPDPLAAFTHLRTGLRSGGRIDLAVWASPKDNPWMSEGVALARRHIELPSSQPRAPGPFAFAEPDYLMDILTRAGFRDIDFSENRGVLAVGGTDSTPASALAFARNGLASWRLVLEHPESVQKAVAADFIDLYAAHHRPGLGVMMGFAAWLVAARA